MKKKIHNAEELKSAIEELERKKDIEETAIKVEFKEVYQTYRPANILKNTISEVAAAPKFRHNLLNIAIGLGAGYLSQKLVVGRSAGLLKRVVGTALQFGVTSLVAKRGENENGTDPKKRGGLLRRIFSRSVPKN